MEKKVEEIVNSKKNETVNDLLSLFNSKKIDAEEDTKEYAWNYEIIEESITQPFLIPTVSSPLVVYDGNNIIFTFDGRTLFFDYSCKETYLFLPYPLRDMCLFKTEQKSYFLSLDSQNKLQYNEFKNDAIVENRSIISRNVLQFVKHNKEVYFLSLKKGIYFVNQVFEDDGVLKPKVYKHNLISEHSISLIATQKRFFIYQDGVIISDLGKKYDFVTEGIISCNDHYITYKRVEQGVLCSLTDEEFVVKSQLMIKNNNQNIKHVSLGDVVCLRVGFVIYLLQVNNNQIVIGKEIEYDVYPLAFTAKKNENKIFICKLLSNVKDKIKEEDDVKFVSHQSTCELPNPTDKSRVYDPINNTKTDESEITDIRKSSDTHEDIVSGVRDILVADLDSSEGKDISKCVNLSRKSETFSEEQVFNNSFNGNFNVIIEELFKKFEKKMNERDVQERKRQNELLDKISDHLNNTLLKVVQKIIKSELETVQRRFMQVLDKKLSMELNSNAVNETKILNFTKSVICETLLPVVEASMDEMRIQVVNEVKTMNNSEHMKAIKKALNRLHLSNSKENLIKNYIEEEEIDKAIETVVKGDSSEMEIFIFNINMNHLENVSSGLLLSLLEKAALVMKKEYKVEYDQLIYHILINVELENLSLEELDIFLIVLSQLQESNVILEEKGNDLSVLIDFIKFKIPKVISKRRRMLN